MPGTRPGMTSFATETDFIGCFLSQTLRSGRVAKDDAASWFETGEDALLTVRSEIVKPWSQSGIAPI